MQSTLANNSDKCTNLEGVAVHRRHLGRLVDGQGGTGQGTERATALPPGHPLKVGSHRNHESLEGAGHGAEPHQSRAAALQRPLGSTAVFAAAPKTKGPEGRRTARDSRWDLGRTAAQVTGNQRQLNCGRSTTGGNPQIFCSGGTASYAGVQTCGLLWSCPVCATKITEQRRSELLAGIEGWTKCTLNMTRTIRHTKWDDLGDLVEKQREAHRKYTAHRAYKRIRQQFGATKAQGGGVVRGLEVTHAHPGKWDHNGWHPHEHELWFCNRPEISESEVADAQEELAELWIDCCRRVNLPAPSMERGLLVEKGKAEDYVAKWGIAEELTKGHLKQGKCGSLSTWGLLKIKHEGGEHAKRAAALYKEFTTAFRGRHQLQWSRGLREILGLKKERSDEELAAATEEAEANFVCEIQLQDWHLVRKHHMQSQVLSAAEQQGALGVEMLLDRMRRRTND